MKRRPLLLLGIFLFLLWNLFTYLLLSWRQTEDVHQLRLKFDDINEQLRWQASENRIILQALNQAKQESQNKTSHTIRPTPRMRKPILIVQSPQLAVVVMACDRTSVSRNLDQLLKYRPSVEKFPIIVSQDCGHVPTANVIKSYQDLVTHIQHTDLSNILLSKKDEKFRGYYKIARHYKWALFKVFHQFNYSAAIIVEDDLDISPDFYEYFSATYPILAADPTLWCVSAWNDNGKTSLISDDAELLYRTDFFPGLGWMLEKKTWLELEPKWPATFWDDWMRRPEQRQDRACIRPEISRTSTFGRQGVSRGQYFDKHLKFIQHYTKFVPFSKLDLSYLMKSKYERTFVKNVYKLPLVTSKDLFRKRTNSAQNRAVRLEYVDKNSFELQAQNFGLMDDFKAGVPRSAYKGIVSFMFRGQRVFLSPANWTSYDASLWN